MKRHLNWTDVGSLLVVSLTLSGLIWHRLEPRAVLVFVALIVLTETIVQFRWRMGLAWSSCGFDPLLYSRRPEAARERVRRFYDRRSQQPDFLLTAHALIETQKRYQKRDQALRKKHPQLDQQGALATRDRKNLSPDAD